MAAVLAATSAHAFVVPGGLLAVDALPGGLGRSSASSGLKPPALSLAPRVGLSLSPRLSMVFCCETRILVRNASCRPLRSPPHKHSQSQPAGMDGVEAEEGSEYFMRSINARGQIRYTARKPCENMKPCFARVRSVLLL